MKKEIKKKTKIQLKKKKYQIIKVIGDGTYGQVYEGINKETNMKKYKKQGFIYVQK